MERPLSSGRSLRIQIRKVFPLWCVSIELQSHLATELDPMQAHLVHLQVASRLGFNLKFWGFVSLFFALRLLSLSSIS